MPNQKPIMSQAAFPALGGGMPQPQPNPAMGMPMPMPMPAPQQAPQPVPAQAPTPAPAQQHATLTAEQVQAVGDVAAQKQYIGDILYQRVVTIDERLAPRIVGMMLELPQDQVLSNVNNEAILKQTALEAIKYIND